MHKNSDIFEKVWKKMDGRKTINLLEFHYSTFCKGCHFCVVEWLDLQF